MSLTLILTCILAPALFWCGYFYYKDRYKPEPLLTLGLTYILGYISAIFCFTLYRLLPLVGLPADPSLLMETPGLPYFFFCIGPVGFLEEIAKFLPYILIATRFKAFDEKNDGFVYAAMIALGFASYENFFHLQYLDGFQLFGRAIASPLTHSIFSSIWGYWVASAKFSGKSTLKAGILGITVSALSHGLFDFFTTSPRWRIFSAITILIIWIWIIVVMDRLNKKDNSMS